MRHPTFLECYHSFQRIYNGGGGHLCAGDSPNMVEKQGQMLSSIRPPSVPPPIVIWAINGCGNHAQVVLRQAIPATLPMPLWEERSMWHPKEETSSDDGLRGRPEASGG